jgi:hypothetical protein
MAQHHQTSTTTSALIVKKTINQLELLNLQKSKDKAVLATQELHLQETQLRLPIEISFSK